MLRSLRAAALACACAALAGAAFPEGFGLFPFLRLKLTTIDNPWRRAAGPAPGEPEAIGFYSAGCLRGGTQLAPAEGRELMRPSRNRHFGHPALVAYLEGLSAGVKALGAGSLLIGDLGQPRGGPTLSGHESHQSGLDADVWYLMPAAPLAPEERETLSAPLVVLPEFEGLDERNWRPVMVEVLRLAAEDSRSQRLFVNPVVKREACRLHPGEAWLAKLRPWWGHDDHFHVRLSCPAGDRACRGQEAVSPGDECGKDLEGWFTPARKRQAARKRAAAPTPAMPRLPQACKAVLAAP